MSLVLAMAASVYLAFAIVWVGGRMPGYRHLKHTISELGEIGAPYQRWVALTVFLPVGLATLGVTWLQADEAFALTGLSGSLAVGYLVAAACPCDPGSPMWGTFRHGIHQLGGAVEYIGGALSLMWLAEIHGAGFRLAGMLVGVAMLLLSFPLRWRGLIQHIAETCLFGGLVLALGLNSLN